MKPANLTGSIGCIFLVTHLVPYPPARGIELRIYRLLQWLRAEGYRVILIIPAESLDVDTLSHLEAVTDAVYWTRSALRTRLGRQLPGLRRTLWEPLKPLLGKAGRSNGAKHAQAVGTSDGIKRGLCPDQLVQVVSRLARKYRPCAVIAEYIFLTPCFEVLAPETLKIIDTIDVFSRKQDQVLAFGIEDPYACTEAEERTALLRADVVLAIQAKELEQLQAIVPEREVLLVGMDFEAPRDLTDNLGERDTISVIASDNALNVHGLRAFLAECWPRIKAAHPTAVLNIVGKVGRECASEDPDVCYSGWAGDLDAVYQRARVIINPTIAGTGLKIKSAEALAHGKPLVAWPHGVDGLEYAGLAPYVLCRSWQEFADAVVHLLKSESEARALAQRALAYARTQFSADHVYASLRERLSGHRSRAGANIR